MNCDVLLQKVEHVVDDFGVIEELSGMLRSSAPTTLSASTEATISDDIQYIDGRPRVIAAYFLLRRSVGRR